VSPDVDGASIAIGAASGRSGRGGLEFTVGGDSDNFAYGQYGQVAITAAQTQTFGFAINQTAAQGALGGRLLTLVDGAVDVFGETVQVAINIMPDSTLQATRANAQGTGIILRGIDQGVDAQMTLLGNSTDALIDTAYLEIQVFHHPTAGSVIANFYDLTHVLTSTWTLVNVNTAISGVNQSSSFCYGGYAATDLSFSQRYHEDLAAILSDVYVLNGLTNPDDARDPTSFLGDTAFILVEQTNNSVSDWTPDPVQANYLNVTEIPPDAGSTENTTFTVDDEDAGELTAVTGSTEEVILAYSADIKNDSSDTCVSNVPAEFEALVYLTETEPGTVIATFNDNGPCFFTDYLARRAQSVCTIASDGESVTWKLNAPFNGFHQMFVGLSPLDSPPVIQVPSGPGGYQAAVFNHLVGPVNSAPSQVTYTAPYGIPFAPAAYAADTEHHLASSSDFFEFRVLNIGIGVDVGLIDNLTANAPFNPYTSPLVTIHIREEIIGSPFFWISDTFTYNGETTYPYSETDNFRLTRNGADIDITLNGFAVETFTPAVMPTNLSPYTYMGHWGWDAVIPGYTLQPGIKQAFVQIAAANCVRSTFNYLSTVPGSVPTPIEVCDCNQWAVNFNYFTAGPTIDATIFDPNAAASPNTPAFGCDLNTIFTLSLVGGNVLLTVDGWIDYADFMTTVVGNTATWLYTRPYADTDDFVLQPPYNGFSVGVPTFPFLSFPYAFVNQAANQPLRLVTIIDQSYDPVTPIIDMGITDVSFVFVPAAGAGPMNYAGQMTQNTVERAGTETAAPSNYHYKQSFLASAPDNTAITVDDVNDSTHGYKRSS
jgi:hypothetical protein